MTTNVFPHYRKAIWKLLLTNPLYNLKIFYGLNNHINLFSPPIDTTFSKVNQKKIYGVKNYWLFKKYLVWQSRLIQKVIVSNYDCIILLGDIATLSSWILIFISKIRNKKIIIWSHGIYGKEKLLLKRIRLFQLSLADDLLIYGDWAEKLLINNGFESEKIHVVYNSLDYEYQKKLLDELKSTTKKFNYFLNNSLPTILFIGRITKEKKLNQLFEAYEILNRNSYKYNLLLIGNGEERLSLENKYQKLINDKKVYFLGELYDEKLIASHIYFSDICVSPGNIGLTAIHSLTYNTPVITHNNYKNQMPEAEVILNGENGFLFEENDVNDLAQKIETWFNQNHFNEDYRKEIDKKYNPYYQNQIFTKAIFRSN